ncbi:hypothetical protein PLESTB_001011000 [Pleodorina starrii]|uniref:CBS domain-containing protein n=1 Tax=Pleodorina starrii TaxID=330485 RepID=A0A9W6BP17_9CHLO|nr:hypothetical protein PLESTM_001196400 [Pleodorina starrii]GLC55652.1 hypothetical protein PLESTB_001011000 [Pleodorina starrii]GLC65402.1 hypothetical protein PLESTF_000289500 [Pleodorina starrii]
MVLSEALAAAEERLSKCPLSAIIPQHQNIVCLEHNNTVGAALQLLAKRHILSAPLVIMPGLEDLGGGDMAGVEEAASAPQLIGWVTVESILRAFLSHLEEKHGKLPRNMLLLMTQLEKEGPAFAEKPLITVSGSEDRGLMFQVHADVSLLTALRESFVPAGKSAAHRLAVFDPSGSITAVISQLDVIRHLREHPELLGDELASATVEQLGWAQPPGTGRPGSSSGSGSGGGAPAAGSGAGRPLLTVEASLPAILAYERMARAGVSGAPVVADAEAAVGSGGGNGSGNMIANLSMSDLRNIQSQHLGILALPVGEFLALLHNTSYLGYSQRTSAQAAHPFFASGPPTMLPPPSPSASPRRAPSSSGVGVGAAGGGMAEGGEAEGGEAAAAAVGIRMITCGPETTLLQVLSLLSDNKVHRVYVGAPNGGQGPLLKPMGVITPTDILRLLTAGKAARK